MRSESDAKAVQSTIRATSVAPALSQYRRGDPGPERHRQHGACNGPDGEDALGMGTAGGGTDVGVLVGGIAGGIFGGALLALGLAGLVVPQAAAKRR